MRDINLQFENQHARIDAGELVGYLVDEYQVMHQKGSPGWRSSDTEMFPIIGPTAEADFKVKTPLGPAVQDQHGLLREMQYACIFQNETKAVFEKVYVANSPMRNSKFPDKSIAEVLTWPYDFRFRKTFELSAKGLTVSFSVSSEKGMPFMLGYHPAFKLSTDKPVIEANGQQVYLDQIIAVGNRAFEVNDCTSLVLHDGRSVKLTSTGFRHFMCWTEVLNMVCLEPITFYPYAVTQDKLHEGFDTVEEKESTFSLRIAVLD